MLKRLDDMAYIQVLAFTQSPTKLSGLVNVTIIYSVKDGQFDAWTASSQAFYYQMKICQQHLTAYQWLS